MSNRNRRRRRPNQAAQPSAGPVSRGELQLVVRGNVVGTFRLADSDPPIWEWIKFVRAAHDGLTTESLTGLIVMYDLLEAVIHPDDWPLFDDACRASRPSGNELINVVRAAMAVASGRPTTRPAESSAGSPTTTPTSTDGSSSPGTSPSPNRPDLAAVADMVPYLELAERRVG